MDQVHSLRFLIDLVEGKKGRNAPSAEWQVEFSDIFNASLVHTKSIFSDIQEKVERFITTKLPNPISPDARYGKHDGPMTGPLGGFYHCHLRDDALLIYRLKNRVIFMVCIVSHAETEGKRGKKLRNQLQPFLKEDDDEYAGAGEEGCWVLPDGSVEYTDYPNDIHHADLVSHMEIDDDDEFNNGAMRQGYIRVRWQVGGAFYVEAIQGENITPRAIRALKALAVEHDNGLFVAEVHGDEGLVHKQEDNPNSFMVSFARLLGR